MNRVIINLEILRHNLRVINSWMSDHGAAWTVVTKVCCGHADTLRALHHLEVQSIGESRLENLRAFRRVVPDLEAWYLRMPSLSSVDEVVALSQVSLNSEISIIEALDREAGRQGKKHLVIIMIELGDLREGILPGSLVKFYEQVFELPNIEVLGIGANLGCLAGAVPTVDQFMQLVLYRELLELKFGRRLPMISAGSSVSLPLVLHGKLPRAINHFRIGEAVFLGTDLIGGGTLPGLRTDAVILEAEIVEIKEKSLVSQWETAAVTPFNGEHQDEASPGRRGYRALVNVGQLDTQVEGLRPENRAFRIAGASSDITVVNIGDEPNGLGVGDSIRFHLDYAAMLRLMGSKYIERVVRPQLGEFESVEDRDEHETEVLPVLGTIN